MMKRYYYEVLDKKNFLKSGYFEGTEEEFFDFLKTNNFFLISYKEVNNKLLNKKFNKDDFINFIEELEYLLNAEISLDIALKKLIESSSKSGQKKFLEDILFFLKEGKLLSQSIKLAAKQNGIDIDEISILFIEVNENVGNIKYGLKKSYEHLKFKSDIYNEIKQAITYPVFLIIMSILLVFFVFTFIVPKFSEIFTKEEFKKLPFLSKIILNTGVFVNNNIYYILLFLLISIIYIFLFRKKFLETFLNILEKINYFKKLIYNLQLSYFFGSLSLMLEGGLDIKKALKESKKILQVKELLELVEKLEKSVVEGEKLSTSLLGNKIIEPNIISLIAVGETSGNLSKIFKSISDKYLKLFKQKIKNLLNLLEPLIIVFVGVIIAFIVIAIMMAVMSVNDVV